MNQNLPIIQDMKENTITKLNQDLHIEIVYTMTYIIMKEMSIINKEKIDILQLDH